VVFAARSPKGNGKRSRYILTVTCTTVVDKSAKEPLPRQARNKFEDLV